MPRWLLILLSGILVLTIVDGAYLVALSPDSSDKYVHTNNEANHEQQSLNGPVLSVLIDSIGAVERFIERHEKLLIVLATIAIAAFTYTLWRATSGLFKMAEKQSTDMAKSLAIAQKSADAAERQSKAAIAVELPILRIIDLKLAEFDRAGTAIEGNDPVPGGNLHGLYKILFCYKNVGRTIATVEKVVVDYKVTQFLPEQPQYQDAKLVWLPFDIEPQASSWFPWPDTLDLSQEERLSINTRTAVLWIYGFVRYTDFMGDAHESRFLGFWNAAPRQPQTNGIVFGVGLGQYKTNT